MNYCETYEMGEQVKQGVDQNKIQEFMNKAIGDIASSSRHYAYNSWGKTCLV